MASNLSSIGFRFQRPAEFEQTMTALANDSIERLCCPHGEYAIWRSRTGAEIWFHLPFLATEDQAGEIVGLTPWFEGTSKTPLKIRRPLQRADDNAFEGSFEGFAGEPDPATEDRHRIIFEAVDFAAHVDRAVPFHSDVRLTGFARKLDGYKDEAAFLRGQAAADADTPRPEPPALMSIAMLDRDQRPGTPAVTDAVLTGHILEHRQLINEVTGTAFAYVLLDCSSCHVDVLADPDVVTGPLAEDGIAQVVCQLFGRLLS